MKFGLLLLFLVPGFAMAEIRYECVPLSTSKILSKAVILDRGSSSEIELWAAEGLISKTAAEYGDDVDSVYYFSKAADVNIYFYWADMQSEGVADGEIVLNANAAQSERISARCQNK